MTKQELAKKKEAYKAYLSSPKGKAEALLDQLDEQRLRKLGYIKSKSVQRRGSYA